MNNLQPKKEHKFTFGLWTVGNPGRDPFGEPTRQQISPVTIVKRLSELGNTTRLSIFRYLVKAGHEGAPVGQIQKALGIPGSTLSHHLSRLVSAGLVKQVRDSRILFCVAQYAALNELIEFLRSECCEGVCDNR